MRKLLVVVLGIFLFVAVTFGQTHWAAYTDGPVLEPSIAGWDNTAIIGDYAMWYQDTLRMWYHDWPNDGIGYAWSLDGINWTKFAGNPVIVQGPELWDNSFVAAGAVVEADGEFIMAYNGWLNTTDAWQTGIATAPHPWGPWTKITENPVLTSEDPDEDPVIGVRAFGLEYESGEYQMWYEWFATYDTPGHVCYGTSDTLTNWDLDYPELISSCGPDGVFEGELGGGHSTFAIGETRFLYYSRHEDFFKGLAMSIAGGPFEHSPWNPVMNEYQEGQWFDKISRYPVVLFDPVFQIFRLWFTGYYDGVGDAGIGYATSLPGYRGLSVNTEGAYLEPGSSDVLLLVTYEGEVADIGFNVQTVDAEDVVQTTTPLYDDGAHGDGDGGDGVFGGNLQVPESEGFFEVRVDDAWVHADASLPYHELDFTTAGPLTVQSVEQLHPDLGAIPAGGVVYFNLNIENLGSDMAIGDNTLEISPADTNSTLAVGSADVPDLLPGATQVTTSHLGLRIADDCADGTPIHFNVKLMTGGMAYWEAEVVLLGIVALDDDRSVTPKVYVLEQNYPNPFNPSTTISYDLSEAGKMKLNVFDVRGKHVAELVQGYSPAGHYEIRWDGRDGLGELVETGVYFCRLEAGEYSQTVKMVYMK